MATGHSYWGRGQTPISVEGGALYLQGGVGPPPAQGPHGLQDPTSNFLNMASQL